LYGPPAVAFAVNVEDVATPLPFVVAVVDAVPFANVPLAPLAGAVKVTVTPLTGLFRESFTVACRAVANAVLTVAFCGVPPVAVIFCVVPPLPVALNAAITAPQTSDEASDALADAVPAASCI
jgi:hypothetical protein